MIPRRVPLDVSAPLLLLSRLHLATEDVQLARRLCEQISDWELFVSLSQRKFCAPVVHRNLRKVLDDAELPEEMERLRTAAGFFKIQSLRIQEEAVAFQERVLDASGIPGLHIKGPSLAARYYDDPALRFSRDVDILVRGDSMENVIAVAMDNGYSVHAEELSDGVIVDREDIRTLVKYDPVVHLVSPSGGRLEIHQFLDFNLGLFDTDQLFADCEAVDVHGITLNVPSTSQLFCYVSLHNTKHMWSRLNWLVDLDAMINHSSFDREAVSRAAERIGVAPVVNAAIDFNELTKRAAELPHSAPVNDHATQLLVSCLDNLEGDIALEQYFRSRFNRLGLPYAWPISSPARWKATLHRLRAKLRPSVYQYKAWPLPKSLQWLYYPTKPLFAYFRHR